MTAVGQKRTWRGTTFTSAFGPTADIHGRGCAEKKSSVGHVNTRCQGKRKNGHPTPRTATERDALEQLLDTLAGNPNVTEVNILAHSMGNWLTLEALRGMAIRGGKIGAKINSRHDTMLLSSPAVSRLPGHAR